MEQVTATLLRGVPDSRKPLVAEFICSLFKTYSDLYFTYLEINPLVVTNNTVYVLDMAAKLDDTADYLCSDKWQVKEFPTPFGRKSWPEEEYIKVTMVTYISLGGVVGGSGGSPWTFINSN